MERVLAFRGSVNSVKAKGTRIIVEFEVNPKWDLPMSEKVESLSKGMGTGKGENGFQGAQCFGGSP